MTNIYYWEKLTSSKLVVKVNFSERKFEEMDYFGIFVFSCLSSTKLCLIFLLICFAWKIKGFYPSSSGNEVDFKDIWFCPGSIFFRRKYRFLVENIGFSLKIQVLVNVSFTSLLPSIGQLVAIIKSEDLRSELLLYQNFVDALSITCLISY